MLAWALVHRLTRLPFAGSLVLALILGVGLATSPGVETRGRAGVLLCVLFIAWSHRRNVREWMAGRPGRPGPDPESTGPPRTP
jgi:hypothetical protein